MNVAPAPPARAAPARARPSTALDDQADRPQSRAHAATGSSRSRGSAHDANDAVGAPSSRSRREGGARLANQAGSGHRHRCLAVQGSPRSTSRLRHPTPRRQQAHARRERRLPTERGASRSSSTCAGKAEEWGFDAGAVRGSPDASHRPLRDDWSMSEAPILICYDDSPAAVRAIEAAASLLGPRPAVVVNVLPLMTASEGLLLTSSPMPGTAVEELNASEARRVAGRGAEIARSSGFAAEPRGELRPAPGRESSTSPPSSMPR